MHDYRSDERMIAEHMVDALTYLIRIASGAGFNVVVSKLQAAQLGLIHYLEGERSDADNPKESKQRQPGKKRVTRA